MRRILGLMSVVVLVAGLLAVAAPPAGAVVLSASDLAADCNDDGLVNITVNTQYVGGSADIWGAELSPGRHFCLVDLRADNLSVAFVNVNLRAKGDVSFNVGQRSSFANTGVLVLNSTIDMHPPEYDGGFVSIKTGCCAGEPFEHDAKVGIVNSRIRGTSVELGASPSGSKNGQFVMTGTTVEATGDEYATVPDVVIRSNGTNGRIRGLLNTFVAANGLRAETGPGGQIWMVGNRFTGVGGPLGVVLTNAPGGSCLSVLNTPAVACT